MNNDNDVATTPVDVKRYMARNIHSISHIIYAPVTPHDRNRVDMYVLRIDSTIGTFRGIGSSCVTKVVVIDENLIAPSRAGVAETSEWRNQPYARALSIAEERVAKSRADQNGVILGAVTSGTLSFQGGVTA